MRGAIVTGEGTGSGAVCARRCSVSGAALPVERGASVVDVSSIVWDAA